MSKPKSLKSKTPAPVPVQCDEIIVSLVLYRTDTAGKRIWEQNTDPVKVFRANSKDLWKLIDADVKSINTPKPAAE